MVQPLDFFQALAEAYPEPGSPRAQGEESLQSPSEELDLDEVIRVLDVSTYLPL